MTERLRQRFSNGTYPTLFSREQQRQRLQQKESVVEQQRQRLQQKESVVLCELFRQEV